MRTAASMTTTISADAGGEPGNVDRQVHRPSFSECPEPGDGQSSSSGRRRRWRLSSPRRRLASTRRRRAVALGAVGRRASGRAERRRQPIAEPLERQLTVAGLRPRVGRDDADDGPQALEQQGPLPWPQRRRAAPRRSALPHGCSTCWRAGRRGRRCPRTAIRARRGGSRSCPSPGAIARGARYRPVGQKGTKSPCHSLGGAVDIGANAPRVAAVTLDWPVKPVGSDDHTGRHAPTDTGGKTCAIRTGTCRGSGGFGSRLWGRDWRCSPPLVAAAEAAGVAGVPAPRRGFPRTTGSRWRAARSPTASKPRRSAAGARPARSSRPAGIQVVQSMYDTLTVPNDKGEYVPYLAKSVTPNADFTQWTIVLRDGITVPQRLAPERRRGEAQPRPVPPGHAVPVRARRRQRHLRRRPHDRQGHDVQAVGGVPAALWSTARHGHGRTRAAQRPGQLPPEPDRHGTVQVPGLDAQRPAHGRQEPRTTGRRTSPATSCPTSTRSRSGPRPTCHSGSTG